MKILVAVDPFTEINRAERRAVQTVGALLKRLESRPEIVPVYVMPPEITLMPAEIFLPPAPGLDETVRALMRKKLKGLKIPGARPGIILDRGAVTVSGAVEALVEYALEERADLIIVPSHSRQGVLRLFLGSFAESLVLQSRVPVLVVGAGAQAVGNLNHILFPTDFSPGSEILFPRVLGLARLLGARVTVLHALPKPTLLSPGARLAQSQVDYLKGRQKDVEADLQALVLRARAEGVTASPAVLLTSDATSEAIVKYAHRHGARLIAMAARSGRASALLTGSITRQVARSAGLPVWILHEKALRAALEKETLVA